MSCTVSLGSTCTPKECDTNKKMKKHETYLLCSDNTTTTQYACC